MRVLERSRLGLAALVVANLIIAFQAAFRDWGYYETLLIYWLEAVVIGVYNALRLVVVGLWGEQPFGAWVSRWVGFTWAGRLFYTAAGTAFFAFKFAGFALMVGLWVLATPAAFSSAGQQSGHVLVGLRAAGPGVAFGVGALLVSHGYSFVRNFLLGREYAQRSVAGLIFWPYARMFLVAVVLGLGLAVISLRPQLRSTTVFVVVLVLIKLAADAAGHLWERRVFGSRG